MTDTTENLPTIDSRAERLAEYAPLQILICFQTLALRKGMLMTRGLTRTRAAAMINDWMGVKAVTRSSKAPRPTSPDGALVHYCAWAIAEAERRAGVHLDFSLVH